LPEVVKMNPVQRFLLLALACIAGSLTVNGCAQAAPPEDPVVVILRDGLPVCSGFAVGPHELLTAAHCVADSTTVAYTTAEQWRDTARAFELARVMSVDPTRDIARLHAKLNFDTHYQLRRIVEGEPVASRSVFYSATTRGRVLPAEGLFRDSTLTVIPGWSGSPVLGADGRAVGVVRSCQGGIIGATKFCLPNNAVFSLVVP
jgi:hypothetical protein